MVAPTQDSSGADAGGGLLTVLLLVSGSALSLLTLPTTFQLGQGPVQLPTLVAAIGGGVLLAAGIALSVSPAPRAVGSPGSVSSGASAADGR